MLIGSTIFWNTPQLFAAGASALTANVPALAPVAAAVVTLRGLGVGFNPGVCVACTTAVFKIVALCFFIGRLMSSGRLPRETPVVLSKLAFNVLLPTYMCTRVAATLNSTPLTLSLAALPVSAVMFVLLGGAVGTALTAAAAAIPGLYRKVWHSLDVPAVGRRSRRTSG